MLPIEMNGQRFGARLNVPTLGSHSRELLAQLGYGDDEITQLESSGAIKTV
ncbi:hypothetical protein D3C79_1010140 [compost metagenome]